MTKTIECLIERNENEILEDNRDRYQREELEWKDEWNTVV